MLSTDNKATFLLVGNGSYSNRGCEAIVRGTAEILRRHFPAAQFILSSIGKGTQSDADSETDPGVEHRVHTRFRPRLSPFWWRHKAILQPISHLSGRLLCPVEYHAVQESDCVLQVGGDNYSLDYGDPGWLVRLDQILLSTGKPVVIWGGSVGPFKADADVERLMSKHLPKLALICARESETVDYLASIGVKDNVVLVADPAFFMPPSEPELSKDLREFIAMRPIGLNLSPLIGRFRQDGPNGWLNQAGRIVHHVVEAGLGPVLLIPHVMAHGNSDHAFMLDAVTRIDGLRENARIVPPTLTASQYKWIIARLRAFAGCRMHSTIAALSSGVPTLSLGYSMKSRGINRDIFGHTDWILWSQHIAPETVTDRLETLIASETDVRSRLNTALPEVYARAHMAGTHLAGLLGVESAAGDDAPAPVISTIEEVKASDTLLTDEFTEAQSQIPAAS